MGIFIGVRAFLWEEVCDFVKKVGSLLYRGGGEPPAPSTVLGIW